MNAVWIILILLAALVLLFFLVTFLCFFITFYGWKDPRRVDEEFDLPPGKVYKPFYPVMRQWMRELHSIPFEEVCTTSFDGLKLYGKYYECIPNAPIELMFHGYRGNAERDLCGGVQRCFALGRNVLVVDQRTSGKSGGKVISFGINESRDCHSWVNFLIDRFGPEVQIILTGISMGAATVMIAAGQSLPKNVIGALADCGYTSAEAIIKKVIRQIHLPAGLLYPVIKLSAKLYGRFDLEEFSPIDSMRHCTIPIIFAHGEADDFVPCSMSLENYEACTAPKAILTIPGAGHGLSYPMDSDAYLSALRNFPYQTVSTH